VIRSLVLVALLAAAPAAATTWSITSTADAVAVDGVCSLREAIRAAATDLAVNECPAGGAVDEIVLAVAGPFVFDQGQETLSGVAVDLTVRGAPGSGFAEIHLLAANRFLRVASGARLTLRNVGLVGGSAHGQSPAYGGAIRVENATLTLRDVVVSGSSAINGGAVSVFNSSSGRTITIENTLFFDNLATAIDSGVGTSCAGGGLDVIAQENTVVRLSDVSFVDNQVDSDLPGSVAIGGGMRLSLADSVHFEGRRLLFDGNGVEALGFVRSAGFSLSSSVGAAGSVILEDLRIGGDALFGPTQSDTTREFNAEVSGAAPLALRRVRSYGFSRVDQAQLIGRVEAVNGATAIVSDLLSVGGPPKGVRLSASGAGSTLVAGNLTVVGHAGVGVELSESAGAELRLENSILWSNGPGPANDLQVLIGEPDYDRTAQRNWIGELGDPDPLFEAAGAGDFHLQEGSGALDAGDAAFASVGRYDADHAPRVAGEGLDLGAFERDALFGDGFESADTAAWEAFDF
jgi:CSLREA domain-containing protein